MTARGLAGTLTPGIPVTSTGRSVPRSSGAASRAAITGPVQASRTTSGRSRRSIRRTAPKDTVSAGPPLASRICAADGSTGLAIIN